MLELELEEEVFTFLIESMVVISHLLVWREWVQFVRSIVCFGKEIGVWIKVKFKYLIQCFVVLKI